MILSLILWFPDISQHLFLFFSKGPKHLFLVPFLKGAFKTRSSRAGCTFKLVGRQPAKPLVLASSGRSPSQTPNQQASLFMSACYCWAVFRNKRKLKSLAVRRHPELTEGWGAAEDGGGEWKAEIPVIPCWCFPDSSSDSSLGCASEQWKGKLERAAGGREPHSWEDASPTNRPETLGFSVQQVAQHVFRVFLLLPHTQCTRRASPFEKAGLGFNAGHGASLWNAERRRCRKPTWTWLSHSGISPLTHCTNLSRRQRRTPAPHLSEPLLRVIFGCGFWVIVIGTRVDRRFTGLEMRSVSGKGWDVNYGLARTASSVVNMTRKLDKKFGEACENRKFWINLISKRKKKNLILCLTSVRSFWLPLKKKIARFQRILKRTTKWSTGKHPCVCRCSLDKFNLKYTVWWQTVF